MNRRLIIRLLGAILLIEAAAMLPSAMIAAYYQEPCVRALSLSLVITGVCGALMHYIPRRHTGVELRAREGFIVVGLAWILMSLFGALPFVLSGMIPHFVDALFESISGFTTTGATVMTVIDGQPHGLLFWRSFTHWIGGMGVLVLTLAIIPQIGVHTSHLVRAESPGPTLSKLVPKMGDTAKILYLIYGIMTVIEFVALMLAGMGAFDAAIHAMGTAGTGGFSSRGASVGAYHSATVDAIITVFMLAFGVNFALYYQLLTGHWRDVLRSEELRWYAAIALLGVVLITLIILPVYGSGTTALRLAGFQVASIISTTGFGTADFNLWPVAAKMVIFVLLFIGSCAGSTAGGMKVVRIAMLNKMGLRSIHNAFQPRKVRAVRFEGKGCDENLLRQVSTFAILYVMLVLVGAVLVSLEGKYDVETNLTAALTCVSNVGPGLGFVGPAGNFAGYGPMAKIVMCILMLAGRLEIYPLLALFHPATWRKIS